MASRMAGSCYGELLQTLPAPGGGGAHQAVFRAGCLGFRAGMTAEAVIADVREHLPAGTRQVPDAEIEQGVWAGFAAASGGDDGKPRGIAPRVAPGTLERLIREGRGTTEADILARSPVPLDWPDAEGWRVLDALYQDAELLFIGDDGRAGRLGETIRPKGEWVAALKRLGNVPHPKIMVNPLTGRPAPKKAGVGETLRGDACVAAPRFAVGEFDGLPLDDQLAFWRVVPRLPVAALVHSGKKSIHAWVRVDCADAAEWEAAVEKVLFPGYLKPLGLDPACKNASRLSRMPGHRRADTGQIQRVLYLAPQGKAVCE